MKATIYWKHTLHQRGSLQEEAGEAMFMEENN